MPGPKRIGDILIARGVIDAATAELIETERLLSRSRFLSAAVSSGRVSEADALMAIAVQGGIPAIDLARSVLLMAVVRRVPLSVARQHMILPVREDGNSLIVAMANPSDRKVIDELAFATGMTILPHAVLHSRLTELLPRIYSTAGTVYRGPLAPEEVGAQEYVPIVSETRALPAGLDLHIEIDSTTTYDDGEFEEAEPIEESGAATVSLGDAGLGFEVMTEPADAAAAVPPTSGHVTPGAAASGLGVAPATHGPAADASVASDAGGPPRPATPTGGRKLVLIVEDEPEIARLIGTTIGQLGHEVIVAGRGLEALQLIKQRRPALIVLDAMLPEVHGFEICRKVKASKRFGNTPVLMISAIYRGWRIAEDIRETYKVDAFLEKPFRVGDLRHNVQQLLERSGGVARDDETLGTQAAQLSRDARAALESGDAVTALEKLRQAESLEPFSAGIQFLMAQALEKRERAFQAIYHYERAIELKPDFYGAARNAAALYQSRGFKNKAAEMWERALRAAPTPELRDQIKQHVMSLL